MKTIITITAAAALLAACGSTATPVVTVTAAPSSPVASAPVETPTPEPSTPDLAATATLYQEFSTDLASLMGTFSDQATAGLVDDAADTLEELGAKAQEGLELPDFGIPSIDTEWDAAMKDYITSARIGVPAIRTLNVSGMNKATAYIQKGTDHISNATAAVENIAG